jgi:hypothetical protein
MSWGNNFARFFCDITQEKAICWPNFLHFEAIAGMNISGQHETIFLFITKPLFAHRFHLSLQLRCSLRHPLAKTLHLFVDQFLPFRLDNGGQVGD